MNIQATEPVCDTCCHSPAPISRAEFAEAVQTPTCPECGRVVPSDEAWMVYDIRHEWSTEPLTLRKLAELDLNEAA